MLFFMNIYLIICFAKKKLFTLFLSFTFHASLFLSRLVALTVIQQDRKFRGIRNLTGRGAAVSVSGIVLAHHPYRHDVKDHFQLNTSMLSLRLYKTTEKISIKPVQSVCEISPANHLCSVHFEILAQWILPNAVECLFQHFFFGYV